MLIAAAWNHSVKNPHSETADRHTRRPRRPRHNPQHQGMPRQAASLETLYSAPDLPENLTCRTVPAPAPRKTTWSFLIPCPKGAGICGQWGIHYDLAMMHPHLLRDPGTQRQWDHAAASRLGRFASWELRNWYNHSTNRRRHWIWENGYKGDQIVWLAWNEHDYLNFMPKSVLFGWLDIGASGIDSSFLLCVSAVGNDPPVENLENQRLRSSAETVTG